MANKLFNSSVFALGLAFVGPALAQHTSYYLNKNETVSQLLYDRLKISPIYRSGALKKILKYNNLSEASSKNLSPGTEIKIPAEFLVEQPKEVSEPVEVAKEPLPETKVEEAPEEHFEIDFKKWVALGVKPTLINGSGKNDNTSFALYIVKPDLETGVSFTHSRHFLKASINGGYIYLAKDEKRAGQQSFLLGEGHLTYNYLFSDFGIGPKLSYGQRMVFITTPNNKYELLSPWLMGVGPSIRWKNLELSYLVYPEKKIKSGTKTDSNKSFALNYEPGIGNNGWRFRGAYLENSTESIQSNQYELSSSYIWYY